MILRIYLGLVFLSATLFAQDPFEIHVYEYEPLTHGEYSLETHLNFDPQGASVRDGTLLPMRNQTHLTLEPTMGVARASPSGSCS